MLGWTLQLVSVCHKLRWKRFQTELAYKETRLVRIFFRVGRGIECVYHEFAKLNAFDLCRRTRYCSARSCRCRRSVSISFTICGSRGPSSLLFRLFSCGFEDLAVP